MNESDHERLHHMLEAAREAREFAEGRSRADLDNNKLLVRGLTRTLEIIGEAASQVSEETREELPEIPWHQITGMRNRLIHAYFDVNLDVVWNTVQLDLGPLIEELEQALDSD